MRETTVEMSATDEDDGKSKDNDKNQRQISPTAASNAPPPVEMTIIVVLEGFLVGICWRSGYFAAASRMAAERFRASARGASWDWARGPSAASMPSLTPGMTTAA
jgi:hypothetical protein